MLEQPIKLSIVVPFYNGNKFLPKLLESVNQIAEKIEEELLVEWEIVIVNDSPEEKVLFSEKFLKKLSIKVVNNEKNIGIHGTRAHGVRKASGDWILFLDQDDELVADGFLDQMKAAANGDVIVGNGYYQYIGQDKLIYKNLNIMKYLIQKSKFIKIRNLIPSPGACLIKKEVIPDNWLDFNLMNNGSDDWLLWLFLFNEDAKFVFNEKCVYRHNDADGKNLSLDLKKMKKSNDEMCDLLERLRILSVDDVKELKRTINFKYLQDIKKLTFLDLIKSFDIIFHNLVYKLNLLIR